MLTPGSSDSEVPPVVVDATLQLQPRFKSRRVDAHLTIGEIAARTGLAASAIRYYERVGLLPVAARASGQRRYPEAIVRRLELIGMAKDAGFSLDEIRVLLDASDAREDPSDALRTLAVKKLPEIEALITRAEAMRNWLLLARVCTCADLDLCALFEERHFEALGSS